jgi:hypothetical protein
VAVKQVFETYVYDLGMSSTARMPFVMTGINATHGNACGATPQGVSVGNHYARRAVSELVRVELRAATIVTAPLDREGLGIQMSSCYAGPLNRKSAG